MATNEFGAYVIHYKTRPSEDPSIGIAAPYNSTFVNHIKSIHPGYRAWDHALKTWTVFDPYIARALDIVRTHYHPIISLYTSKDMVDEQLRANKDAFTDWLRNSERKQHDTNSDYNLLGILPNASLKLIKAAYRVQSQDVHPDTNPLHRDGRAFRTLTEAYERCLKRATN